MKNLAILIILLNSTILSFLIVYLIETIEMGKYGGMYQRKTYDKKSQIRNFIEGNIPNEEKKLFVSGNELHINADLYLHYLDDSELYQIADRYIYLLDDRDDRKEELLSLIEQMELFIEK